ncbi:centrosomal protein of 83 kDa [Bufo bufo]|uniref:centrosomal protein of 83 kDa n=1 Tax=Bufo bufo TaxID=8384 RepID=UPI001ABEE450|nr:centrosomal protein of 83 kDa [Bufo bufo]XP_040264785.1 centrosomal protein of 83 kDa [Bufo bufo]
MESMPVLPPQLGGSAHMTDTELHKLLISEKMRCENHRTNYETLKAEHSRLQANFMMSQNECKQLSAEKQNVQEKFQLLLSELRGELLDQTREAEELKLQVLSPQRLELLKLQIQQELEAPMREHIRKLNDEVEKYRGEYNKLRYENGILTAQLEHQRDEQHRMLEEQNLRFEAQVAQLEKDKEELHSQIISIDSSRDGKRLEALLGEKVLLSQKLEDLKAEVKELRAEREHYGVQAENVQRIQVRQMTETQAALRSLEAEKQSLKLQLERLENELQASSEQNDILTKKLHRAERDVHSLTSKIEELKHSQKIEIDNIKLEATRTTNDAKKDKDRIQSQLDALETENEILKASMDHQKELLAEKERELIRKVQAAKEAGFQQIAIMQDERLELENGITELEKYKEEQEQHKNSEISQMEEKCRIAQLAEESARRELLSLRSKLQHQVAYAEQIKKEKLEEVDLKREITDLKTQVLSLSESENNLLRANENLRDMVERLKQENRCARGQAEKVQQDAERELEGNQVEWLQEKHTLQEELSQIQEKYKHLKEKIQRAAEAQKKRKHIHENRCRKLKEKIELLEAKKEELETEKSVLNRQNIPQEDHVRLQKRMKDLQRRHNEFRTLILGPNVGASGFLNPSSYLSSTIVPEAFSFQNAQEEQHQREISMLRKRLEELEMTQEKQLEELGPPAERSKTENLSSVHQQRNLEEEELSETG